VIDLVRHGTPTTMTNPRTWRLILISTLAACDLGKGTETDDEASDETTDTGTSDETTDTGTETSEDSDGPPTPADFEALCEQQADRAGCEAVPTEDYPQEGLTTWCSWWIDVPVELVDGACSFGAAQPRCQMISAAESGCGDISNACESGEAGWSFVEGESVVIGRGETCGDIGGSACDVDAQGMVVEGAPECACLCDPAFPS
jgi:hypothetical protein